MEANRRSVTNLIGVFLMLVAFLVTVSHPQAEAATAADFYKDKKIMFIAASKAGGESDLIVRIIAPYLKKYTGAYAVLVDNVEEAGGILAINKLWNSKPDGLTLTAAIMYGIVSAEVGKMEGIQFQCEKLEIVSALTSIIGDTLMVNAKGPFHTVDDLRKTKGLKSATMFGKAVSAAYLSDVLGLDARITPGMPTLKARMALMRGEIQFVPEALSGALNAIADGSMRPLCVTTSTPIRVLPNVPSVTKLVSLSPLQREWTKVFDVTDSGKYVFSRPNVPKERIDYLRSVFDRIHKDPQFLQDRKKIFPEYPGDFPWLTGADAQKTYTTYLNLAKGKENSEMVEYLSKKYYTIR